MKPIMDTVSVPARAKSPLGFLHWLSPQMGADFSVVRSLVVDVGSSRKWKTDFKEKKWVVEIVRHFGSVEKLHMVNEYCIVNPDAKFDFSKWGMMLTESGDREDMWNWVKPCMEGPLGGPKACEEVAGESREAVDNRVGELG
jgi:hypothetical protein